MNQNQEIIKIDDEQFGALIQLPDLYKKGQITVTGAQTYTAGILATLEGINIIEVDALEMESKMIPVRECRQFLAEARQEINEARMPHTRKMDEIKKLFTTQEAELKALEDQTAAKENVWEGEKLRRQRVAEKATQDAANKAEEAIRIRTTFIQGLQNELTRRLMAEILAMNNAFNAKTIADLPEYGEALLGWTAEFDEQVFQAAIYAPNVQYHTREEVFALRQTVDAELRDGFVTQWVAGMSEDKARLVDLIPSRIAELTTAASNPAAAAQMQQREEAAKQEIVDTLQQQNQALQEVAQSNAQGESMAAIAQVASQATPVVQMSSGSKVKQKYKVNSHVGLVALISAFIKNDLPKMTVEEACTKFSFVRTACDKRLNQAQPEIIESPGLEVVEDVSTRRSKIS